MHYYFRWEDQFVLLSTHGQHQFFRNEQAGMRDIKRTPVRIGGYSISLRRDPKKRGKLRAAVRIDKETYRMVRDSFLERAVHRRSESIAAAMWSVPFEPYRPIREQLFRVLKQVNECRKRAGYERVPASCLRWKHAQKMKLCGLRGGLHEGLANRLTH